MSKKFSIIKTLDIDKLDSEIEKYICINGETNPYIFMSDETVNAIVGQLNPMDWFNVKSKKLYSNSKIALYTGYKVFVDNDMKYGEIELR